jgi:hypothetical protein
MHWMSVKLPDNFQMREHSWPCRFHIIMILGAGVENNFGQAQAQGFLNFF